MKQKYKKMWHLRLPEYNFRIINQNNKPFIFDQQRKKYVSLTPEEWVRQNFIQYLIQEKKYPASLISIEKQLIINGLKKRYDAVVFNRNANPIVIIEFKAPNIEIKQQTFDQAAVYNSKLKVGYFIISNGISHFCCRIDFENQKYHFLEEIPEFEHLISSL